MKRLLLFVFAIVAFAACEQAPIEEQSAIRQDIPDTITVGFEDGEDATRIQLNEAQKTVWNAGDKVSVFYKSYDNLKFEFEGNTGDRNGTLKRVGGQHNGQTMDDVIVVYPYSEDYMITLSEGCVNAKIPSTQTYLKDSYGVGDNLMIARSSFNQFCLKSVCGWLKIQLTGDGEVIERITFRGNNGEQVAGLVYVDATTAEVTLATAKHNSDDNSQLDGTLVHDNSIYTEVVLDCGEGVTLGAEATTFYIALPPQTFEQGFTVEIEDTEGNVMEQSTDKALSIERNHIQTMAAFEFVYTNSPTQPNQPIPASNEIWYTSSDGNIVTPYTYNTNVFGANITSITYTDGKGVITFDGNVTTIGDSAFKDCVSLTSVNIPDSVTTIGEAAFAHCTSLTSVNIPDSVTTIGKAAFVHCISLTSVTIPDSVTEIGDAAFTECRGLTSVTIGDGVTTIGYEAFAWCESLTSVTISDSVTTIGECAFYECYSLTSVNIPDSVTTIGEGAFRYCDSLKEFTGKFAEDNGRILVFDGVLTAFAPAGITQYTIPDSVTTIVNYAFYGCDRLTSVTIGDSVTTIGNYAFAACDSLTSVTIGDGVTTIGGRAFYDCDSLTEFNGKFASEDGRCLIVDGVINSFAPYGLTEYTIPDSVTTIGDDAFYGCDSLTSITIPDSVTEIGWYAFHECYRLTSIIIPDSVTTIGNYAFYWCDSLTSVTIGDGVTTIGDCVFWCCSSLTSVYCKATTPPSLGYNAFKYWNGSDQVPYGCDIYVPTGSVSAYKSAVGWSDYASAIVGYDF